MYVLIKRSMDVLLSAIAILVSIPVLLPVVILIAGKDFASPFFLQTRFGYKAKRYTLIKIRSMSVRQDPNSPNTTSKNDPRLTPIGKFIRKYKIDELPQFINVLKGDMSLVGPRPQIESKVNLYTDAEKQLFDAKPGITDLASIIFVDLEEIVSKYGDPDTAYQERVRPWKSKLGLYYVRNCSLAMDVVILFLTIVVLFNRKLAWNLLSRYLARIGAPDKMVTLATRREELKANPDIDF